MSGPEFVLDLAVDVFWQQVAPLSVSVVPWVLALVVVQRLLPAKTWPEVRLALWLLVLLRLAIPQVWLPSLPFDPLAAASFSPDRASDRASERAEERVVLLPGVLPPTVIESGAIRPTTDPLPERLRQAAPETVTWWAELVALLWFGGAGTFLALHVAWHRRSVRHWRRDARPAPRPDVEDIVRAESNRLGLRRPPEVLLSPRVAVPLAAGLVHPKIFLPADLPRRLAPDLLAPVILHELAHVRRRDAWLSAAGLLVHAAYWFHPAVWYARLRVHALIEPCCDRTVARALRGEVGGYRRALLLFARERLFSGDPESAPRPSFLQHSFLAPESLILLRLRLLDEVDDRPWHRRAAALALLTALAAASLPTARAADPAIEHVQRILVERPPGCLTLRYLVLRAMSLEASNPATTEPSTDREDLP